MHYNNMLREYADIPVREIELNFGFKGLYKNGQIAIDKKLTTIEKGCILAEEIGHHFKTAGNILNQNKINNVKQEKIARLWAYKKLLPLSCLIEAYENGCSN